MRTALVLGAGGTVGMAYHVGVLRALEAEGGFVPSEVDLVVGTSAGGIVGSLLRAGWPTSDLWQMALGEHPVQLEAGEEELARRRREMFRPTWRSPADLTRRAVGSVYVAARSVARVPGPPVPSALRRRFPGGLFSLEPAGDRLGDLLPAGWPERPLWICAVDLATGRRVVMGREGGPDAPLRKAVLASCAIPGFYQPVRIDGRTLVDGGAWSTTNLDLAAEAGCRLVVGVAPMAYDPSAAPGLARQLVRRFPSRVLRREVTTARDQDAEVLLFRPTAKELAVHGPNLMRPDGAERVARAAYETTVRRLSTDRFRRFLARLRDEAA